MIMKFERNESKKKWWDDDLLIGSNNFACSVCIYVRGYVCLCLCMCVCAYVWLRLHVCMHVCTFVALTEGTAAFILSGKEDRVQRSMREEQNVFEAPKDHIILIK